MQSVLRNSRGREVLNKQLNVASNPSPIWYLMWQLNVYALCLWRPEYFFEILINSPIHEVSSNHSDWFAWWNLFDITGMVIKRSSFGVRPKLEFGLHNVLALWSWARYLISICYLRYENNRIYFIDCGQDYKRASHRVNTKEIAATIIPLKETFFE